MFSTTLNRVKKRCSRFCNTLYNSHLDVVFCRILVRFDYLCSVIINCKSKNEYE